MNRRIMRVGRALAAAVLVLGCTPPAMAARGFVLNAFSAEGLGMGGADIAVVGDTTAINTNPAGLTQIQGQAVDVLLYPYFALFDHKDSLGNHSKVDAPMGAVLSGSYARRLSAWPNVVLSAGLFAQGGTGIGYDSLLNDYGTRDELSSNFGVFKFLSGFGWSVNDKLSLGAALGISYATGKQKVFPETSDVSFPGFRFDGGSTVAPNIHAGLQYRLAPEWTLALAYVSKLKLDLKDGTATFNFEAAGLGRVKYADARIEGFALPQEVDIGVAYAPNSRWLLSLEFNWLDYEDALNDARLRARQPNNPAAQEIDAASPLHWNNQRVVAFGAAYASDDKTTWRAGCNFENSPIPDRYYSPILNLGQKREVTLGYGKRFAMGWAMDFAFEYQLPVEIRYRNPSLAIGESGKDQYEDVSLMIALSRRW